MSLTKSRALKGQTPRGQTLVEFAFVCIIIFAILAGAFYVGNAMYIGQMASDAVHEPAMPDHKFDMADDPSPIPTGKVMSYVNLYEPDKGAKLDSLNYFPAGAEASVIVGQKSVSMGISDLPAFQFTVTQALQQKLLGPANAGGATLVGLNALWRAPKKAPWNTGAIPQTCKDKLKQMPSGLEWFDRCGDRTLLGGEPVVRYFVDAVGGNVDMTFLSRRGMSYASPFKITSFTELGKLYIPECNAKRGQYKGECTAYTDNLVYTEDKTFTAPVADCAGPTSTPNPDLCEDLFDKCSIDASGVEIAGSCVAAGNACFPTAGVEICKVTGQSCTSQPPTTTLPGACYATDGGKDCSITGGRVMTQTITNPPGAPGLRLVITKKPCEGPKADMQGQPFFGTNPSIGVYQGNGYVPKQGQGPPKSYVDDCVDRKVAECMFAKTIECSEDTYAAFNKEECRVGNKMP